MKIIFTTLLSIAFFASFSQTHLVISQVYGGGGNSGAQYTNDYIEIFNPTAASVTMTNWSLQYSPAAGTWAGQATTGTAISGTIAPGKYFLVQLAAGTTTSTTLPTPDAIPTTYLNGVAGTVNMSATGGKIALVSNTTVLGTSASGCPTGAVVDFVGYGTANCGEGTPVAALSNTTAAFRKSGGCQDNDNNSSDFTIAAPAPRNSATAANICNNTLPTINASPGSLTFVTNLGNASAPQSITISAANLFPSNDAVTVTPSSGIEVSPDNVNYFGSYPINYSGGTLANTTMYVRVSAAAPAGTISGTITLTQLSAPSVVIPVSGGVVQPFYSKSSGSLDQLSTYGTNTDGTGTAPTSFTLPYESFTVSQPNATIASPWDVSGTGSTIIVGNGASATTLTIPAAFAISSASKVDVNNNATLLILNNTKPFLNNLFNGSTVNFAETGTTSGDTIIVPAVSYYNLKLTGGIKYFAGNTTTVRGDMTVDGAVGLNGPRVSPFATINSFGNISYINGASFEANPTGDAGRLTLKMNGISSTQTINGTGINLLLFRLERDSTTASGIILTAGTNLVLGNASSGGLLLTPANATLVAPSNNAISLVGGGLFTATALGKMNTTGATISLLKSTTAVNAGIMRFVSGSTLNQLILNFDPAFARDTVTVNDSVAILNTLTLTKGKLLTTSPAVVMMQSAATVSGASSISYVDGKISKTGNAAFTFPVGKSGKYAPVQISALSTANTFTAQYFNVGYGTYTINPATLAIFPYYNVSQKEYWTVDRGSAGSATLTFTYDAASGVTNSALLRIAHFGVTNNWDDIGGVPAGTNTGGTVTVVGVNNFSPFTLGAAAFNVLPIRFVSFTAQKTNNTVGLNWTINGETNTSFYAVEKSLDGINWTTISTVNANAMNSNINNYAAMDNLPVMGMNYYRLREVDLDGKMLYSEIRIVSFNKTGSVIITPNPAHDYVNINMVKNNNNLVTIQIADVSGKIVVQQNTTESTIKLNIQQLLKGIYFVKVFDGSNSTTQKLVVE